MKTKKWPFLAAFVLVAQSSLVRSAGLTTSADFLLLTTGARPDGMGQAFSAVADDINTLSFNPAGLANIHLPEVGYSRVNFISDIHYDFVGTAAPVGSAGVLGLGYVGWGTAPFNSTANSAAPLVSGSDGALIAGWGKSFYDLHVGAAVKYIFRQLDTVQGSGVGFDLGFRYRVMPQLTFAASALNLGPDIKLVNMEPLPAVINVGAAWTVIEEPIHTLNVTSDASFNMAGQRQRYGMGMEYWYRDTVALRAGYLANSMDEGFSAGIGIKVSFIQIDYAFQPYNLLGSVHRFSGIFRWDGPWVSGGEPSAPKYVNVRQTPKDLVIRWEKSNGPVQSYEVFIQPMNGTKVFVIPPVTNPICYLKNYDVDTLYKISVRAIGEDGTRSFPSKEVYFLTEGRPIPAEIPAEKVQMAGKPSVSHGVTGKVDEIGLQLSWEPPPDFSPAGYHLYRKSPSGQVEKVTLEPKHDNRVWVPDAAGFQGWEWIVTAVGWDGKTEKTVGTYLWYPTSNEVDSLLQKPTVRLNATPEKGQKVFLDWDQDPRAVGYSLFFSPKPDGVFELFGNLEKVMPTAMLGGLAKHDQFYFIVAPRGQDGTWFKRSMETKVVVFPNEGE